MFLDVTTESSITTGHPATSTLGFIDKFDKTTSGLPVLEMTTAGYNDTDMSSTVAPGIFPSPPNVRPLGSSKLGTTLHRDKHGNVCICEPE